TGWGRPRNYPRDSTVLWEYLASMGMFVLDLAALAWVGMWQGVRSRRASHAAPATMAQVLLLPWGIFLVGSVGFFLVGALAGYIGFLLHGVASVIAWFVIGLMVDIIFIQRAKAKLHSEFRRAASQRFSSAPGAAASS